MPELIRQEGYGFAYRSEAAYAGDAPGRELRRARGVKIDVLTGGAGLDSFVFDFAPNRITNVDSITDYNVADDRFLLDDAAFAGIGATGALGAARFKLGTAATDADDRIIYDAATGKVYFDANGNGAGGQIHFATVAIGTALTASEFVVF